MKLCEIQRIQALIQEDMGMADMGGVVSDGFPMDTIENSNGWETEHTLGVNNIPSANNPNTKKKKSKKKKSKAKTKKKSSKKTPLVQQRLNPEQVVLGNTKL